MRTPFLEEEFEFWRLHPQYLPRAAHGGGRLHAKDTRPVRDRWLEEPILLGNERSDVLGRARQAV